MTSITVDLFLNWFRTKYGVSDNDFEVAIPGKRSEIVPSRGQLCIFLCQLNLLNLHTNTFYSTLISFTFIYILRNFAPKVLLL